MQGYRYSSVKVASKVYEIYNFIFCYGENNLLADESVFYDSGFYWQDSQMTGFSKWFSVEEAPPPCIVTLAMRVAGRERK